MKYSVWQGRMDYSEFSRGREVQKCIKRGLSRSEADSLKDSENMASDIYWFFVRVDLPKESIQ